MHRGLDQPCTALCSCGSPYSSTRTGCFTGKPQFEKAKALLKEAGSDGKPVVLLHPVGFAVLNKLPPVMARLLQQAGFKVDLQAIDWPTLVARRAKKEPADQGGWTAFLTGWGIADSMNPLYWAPRTGNGEKGWFGWTKDDKLEELKQAFMATRDEARRRQLAGLIQLQALDTGILAPRGGYRLLTAIRRGSVSGVPKAPVKVFWNIRRQ